MSPAVGTASVAGLAARVVRTSPALGSVRLVCIDGPAGAGKTTLASRLVAGLAAVDVVAEVLHMDDLYEGWSGLDDVWDRVESQVLEPLADGRPARWQRYDWRAGSFAEWHELPPPTVVVLEGCGSAPRSVDGRAVLRVFVEAPLELRLTRGLERDGVALRDEWTRWIDLEAAHFAKHATRSRADVVVDGTRALLP